MTNRKPRVWLRCTVCIKRFSENRSQAKKRFTRKNKDQCCSGPCRSLYIAGKFTKENRALALEHNTAAKARMEKGYGVKEKP